MDISGGDIREAIEKKIQEEKPQTKEDILRIIDETIHELRTLGKIRSDADLYYWKNYFVQRWQQFLNQ